MTDSLMQQMLSTSYLSANNASYIEELYEQYLKNPDDVSAEWQQYFSSLPEVNGLHGEVSHADIRDYFRHIAQQPRAPAIISSEAIIEHKQSQVDDLIDCYRRLGHLAASIDPLGRPRDQVPELELSYHDLSESDYQTNFVARRLLGKVQVSLREIHEALRKTYCQHIGFEYKYIRDPEEVEWLRQYIEREHAQPKYSKETQLEILKSLTHADGLEKYLGNKYVGQKRFSLEGGDSFIPMLQTAINHGVKSEIEEIVIGMAHRGRLNVMVNIMGQPTEELFQEFEGRKDYGLTTGDVKYHLGMSSNIETESGQVHLSLMFNPSHLEVIDAVLMGSVRARQDRRGDYGKKRVMAIVVHGDAAFAGQGIVMETLNMSQTRAYRIGGALHIVIDNQVGFTTDPVDARSSTYCTDVAKMIDAPIFHVNGDDPEACAFVTQLAIDYHTKYHKDVVIELVCYRLHGHNEADEPAATQPMMYHIIRQHKAPRILYAQQLIQQGIITQADADKLANDYRAILDAGQQVVKIAAGSQVRHNPIDWSEYIDQNWETVVDTSVDMDRVNQLAKKITSLPENFNLQRQVGLVMKARRKMASGDLPMDWGFAENMAYASLLDEGYPIRISGQDVRRGTFAHRHAVFHDQTNGETYTPLKHICEDQPRFQIYDSILSEAGVVGFEYGYASAYPKSLVVWEAQFGDFANNAQAVIDQFISSGWQKWKRLCGVCLFLPHGQEGMGPEHSSARLERYLQLCAQYNIQVCVPTTPAQTFHMIRRQVIRPFRKPLIVMTPKSLLRHKLAVSSLQDLSQGRFHLVIPEVGDIKADKVKRVVLCSGKVFYDLLIKRREAKLNTVAIIRVEQLYPFPDQELRDELSRYKQLKQIVWCQEEPKNQGAWFASRHHLETCVIKGQKLEYAGREPFAAPAPGYPALHKMQQDQLVKDALGVE